MNLKLLFSNKTKFPLFKIFLILIFIFTICLIHRDFFNNQYFQVHDVTVGARLFEQHQTIADGQFPPRWSSDFGFGYGMPIFQFYAPLAYYIGEVFILLGFSILNAVKLIYILATIVGFWGMYLLAKKMTNEWGGLISAVAFSFAPYHAVDIYVRGAVAEYWAISFFPWILYFTLQLIKKSENKYFLGLVLSLSGLFLSHNISVITFIPFWLVFTSFYILGRKKTTSVLMIGLGFINAFLISSFFLLPAFLQQKFTRAESLTSDYFNFAHHFVSWKQYLIPNWGYGGSVSGSEDGMSFYLGNEQLILLLIIINIFLLFYRIGKIKKNSMFIFLLLLVLFTLALFLTNRRSDLIWSNLPLMGFIQFPWRYLGLASFFLSLLMSFFGIIFKKRFLTLLVIFIIIGLNFKYFKAENLYDWGDLYNPNPEYVKTVISQIIPDYLPANIDFKNIQPTQQKYQITEGEISVDEVVLNSQRVVLKLNSLRGGKIQINRFVFPNWKSKLNGQNLECQVENFVYVCRVPSGTSLLQFYWSEKGINQISNLTSVLGIILLFLVLLREIYRSINSMDRKIQK